MFKVESQQFICKILAGSIKYLQVENMNEGEGRGPFRVVVVCKNPRENGVYCDGMGKPMVFECLESLREHFIYLDPVPYEGLYLI